MIKNTLNSFSCFRVFLFYSRLGAKMMKELFYLNKLWGIYSNRALKMVCCYVD